eukprot:scaffold96219_cov17-Tisochrysis_lutea.AAC.1
MQGVVTATMAGFGGGFGGLLGGVLRDRQFGWSTIWGISAGVVTGIWLMSVALPQFAPVLRTFTKGGTEHHSVCEAHRFLPNISRIYSSLHIFATGFGHACIEGPDFHLHISLWQLKLDGGKSALLTVIMSSRFNACTVS